MTLEEEEFVHFVSCIKDLNEAWRILKLVMRRKNNSLRLAAFRLALIEYAKPYRASFGHIKSRHQLGTEYVADEFLELHLRILKIRDSFLAHSDLTIQDAQVYVSKHPWGNIATVASNVINESQEFGRIDEIILLIQTTLLRMYESRDLREASLSPNISSRL